MDIVELENSFHSILKPELTGVTRFIPANQNGPQPDLPYATYQITDVQHVGRVQRGLLEANEEMPFYEHYEITFRVMVYGPSARNILQDLSTGLCKYDVTSRMAQANIAYSTKTPIRVLPELVQASWEERARMDIICLSTSSEIEIVPIVGSIGMTENLESDSGTTYTNTFVIP